MAGRSGKPLPEGHVPYSEQFEAFDVIGLDALLDAYMETRSATKLLKKVGLKPKARGALYAWLHKQDKLTEEEMEDLEITQTRWQRWQEVRRAVGLSYADDAVEVAENATASTLAVAREKGISYRWAAEQFARQDFGKESRVKHEVSGRLDVKQEWALVLKHDMDDEIEEVTAEVLTDGED